MNGDNDSALMLFLVFVLVVGVGSLLFGDFTNRFTRLVRQAAVWMMIFLVTVLLFSFRDDLEVALMSWRTNVVEGDVIVLNRAPDGHFYAVVEVNGTDVPFVVDTGASQIVLSRQDAGSVGIDVQALNFRGVANTANGQVRTARVTLDSMVLGERVDRGVTASVNGGELGTSLLGMSYLNRFSKLEIERGRMRLVP